MTKHICHHLEYIFLTPSKIKIISPLFFSSLSTQLVIDDNAIFHVKSAYSALSVRSRNQPRMRDHSCQAPNEI